ncbi:MAG: S8 family serine peptidase [Candidatus Nanoarchaeia archaeon]
MKKKKNDFSRILSVLLVLLIVLVLALSVFVSAKTDQKIIEELEQRGKVRAVVVLSEQDSAGSLKQQAAAKKKNNELREQIITVVGKEKILHRYDSKNAFSAVLSSEDIKNLEKNPGVEQIIQVQDLKLQLQDSVVVVNATNTWVYAPFGNNLTGEGRTICVLDSGVNYSHSDLGGCNLIEYELSGNQENYVLESDHNYLDDTMVNWTISMPGFTSISVHFVNISTEQYYDYVRILDGNNNVVASYMGEHQDLWSPSVSGENITIVLDADLMINGYGFYIDKVINGTANMSYDWSNCEKITYGWDIMNSDYDPYDDNGHGTHVAGIVAANGVLKGVAPGADIVAVKISDSLGDTDSAVLSEGIEFCTELSDEYNISVITMSLGSVATYGEYCDDLDPLTTSVINAAVGKNITIIVSTGNYGALENISFPSCINNATRVGSTTKADDITGYSNRWNWGMVFAPGDDINSTSKNGDYEVLSGTSMAAPHAAGAIAILQQYWFEQNNSLAEPQLLFDALNSTGKQLDGGLSRNYSRIDIYSAVLYLNQTGDNESNQAVQFNSSKTIPDLEWEQGDSLEDALDLSEYFYDADGDLLSYVLMGESEVSMEISGNIASFYSPDDFFGEEEDVWIRASDSESTAQSNTFNIVVTRRNSGGGGGGGYTNTGRNRTISGISGYANNSSLSLNATLVNYTLNRTLYENVTTIINNFSDNFTDFIIINLTKPENESPEKKSNISLKLNQEGNDSGIDSLQKENEADDYLDSERTRMTPQQSQLLVKALAGVLSVFAILLVIYLIDKMAKKRAEKINAEFMKQMEEQKKNHKEKDKITGLKNKTKK